MTVRRTGLLLAILLAVPASASQESRQYAKQIAPGVVLYQFIKPDLPLVISALKVRLTQSGAGVGAFVANGTINSKDREVVSRAVQRSGALAGTNGDFFPWTADPLGFTVIDGRVVSEPYPDRPAIAIKPDGTVLIGIVKMALTIHFDNFRLLKPNAIDRPFNGGEMIVLEKYFGASTGAGSDTAEMVLQVDWPGLLRTGYADARIVALNAEGQNTPIPPDGVVVAAKGPRAGELLKAAQGQTTCRIRLALQDEDGRSWLGVQTAVGGEPEIVKNSSPSRRTDRHGLNAKTPFAQSRHPRTAAGVTRDGSLLLAVVDGRQETSRGATLKEIAQIMLDLGCTDALNLDGGGSSTMVVHDLVVNSPSDGQQRMVASGLLVFGGTPGAPGATSLKVSPAGLKLVAGARQPFRLTKPDGTALSESEMASAIWGTGNGGGFIEQDGVFTALKPGSPVVRAWLNGSAAEAAVSVDPAGPAHLKLSWEDGSGVVGPKSRLLVSLKDALGNVSAWAQVRVNVTGGSVLSQDLALGPDGLGRVDITWDASVPANQRKVEVSAGNVTASLP